MTKRTLYLGLDPRHYRHQIEGEIVHWPIIQILPRSLTDPTLKDALLQFSLYSHLILTSKSTVKILFAFLAELHLPLESWQNKMILAIGKATAAALIEEGIQPTTIAKEETAEGIVAELEQLNLKKAHLFWPHSSQARRVIKDFLIEKQVHHTTCVLYDPVPHLIEPLPQLETFDAIVFTSPSTVDAFFQFFKTLPAHLERIPIGPITAEHLRRQSLNPCLN